jgi:hypothetical protein
MTPQAWLSADDPPLLTCYNGPFDRELVNPVMLLRRLGIPARGIYGIQGNTHVPDLRTEATREDGSLTTWGESIYEFFETQLKRVDQATAPEMRPHGGAISESTEVQLLSVHPSSTIHFTLDGTEPSASSTRYDGPMDVKPGQTIRAIVLREGLKPSRITSGTFSAGPPKPTITALSRVYRATVGEPVQINFDAENSTGASWFVGGKTGEHYRYFEGRRFNPPVHIPWIQIDRSTGTLTGTPRCPGVYPLIVSCMTKPPRHNQSPESGDAILIVIRVDEDCFD